MRAGVERCHDILFSIECIKQYLATAAVRGFASFMQKERDAASYLLMIIGETAKNLMKHHRQSIEQVSTEKYDLLANLKDAAKMRDSPIHHFWATKHDIVFSTIQNDLPKLKDFVYRLGAILALS
jgi:uncharacterized protein with HEPN domain